MTDSITPKPEDIDRVALEPNGDDWAKLDLSNDWAKAETVDAIMPPDNGQAVSRNSKPVKPQRKYKHLPKSDWAIGQILARHAGLIGPTAYYLGVHRDTLHQRILKSPYLQKAKEAAIETVKDVAEGNVYRGIQNGDQKDTHFFLRTMGKDRGYTTSSEVTGPEGGEIKIVLSPREAKL